MTQFHVCYANERSQSARASHLGRLRRHCVDARQDGCVDSRQCDAFDRNLEKEFVFIYLLFKRSAACDPEQKLDRLQTSIYKTLLCLFICLFIYYVNIQNVSYSWLDKSPI